MTWQIKKLGEIAYIYSGTSEVTKRKNYIDKGYPAFSATGQDGFTKEAKDSGYAVILSSIGARCGKCFYAEGKWTSIANTQVIKPKRQKDSVVAKFLYFNLNDEKRWPRSGSAQPFIVPSTVKNLKVPFPPLLIQQKIVERLDAVRKAQELNEKQISLADELFQSLLHREFRSKKSENWIVKKLPEVAKVQRGKFTPRPRNDPRYFGGKIPWIQIGEITGSTNGYITTYSQTLNEKGLAVSRLFPKGTIVIGIAASIGEVAILGINAAFPDSLVGIIPIERKIGRLFLFYQLLLAKPYLTSQATQVAQKNINLQILSRLKILVPSLKTQRQIVKKLSAVQEYKKKFLKQKKLLQELFESTLNKAMKGELVK